MRPLGILILFCCYVSADARTPAGTLNVKLNGMTSDEGALVYAVWSDRNKWLGDGAVREGSVPIEHGVSQIRLDDLPYGEYAISAFHDRNGNGKLDTGLFRIPKEPLGTSNDAKMRFGPPAYDDARFVLREPDMTIDITIRKLF